MVLNNTTPRVDGTISLQPLGAKGQMHLTFVKTGSFGLDVLRGDSDVVVNVLESNRKRTHLNKSWCQSLRSSRDPALGGYLNSSGKDTLITFTLHKVPRRIKMTIRKV
jgi:hypothetical protein